MTYLTYCLYNKELALKTSANVVSQKMLYCELKHDHFHSFMKFTFNLLCKTYI